MVKVPASIVGTFLFVPLAIMIENFFPILLTHLQKYVDINEEEVCHFFKDLEYVEFSAKQNIQEQGKVIHGSYFILEGIVRAYTLDQNANEHVMHIALENWWISDFYSFITGKPGNYTIQALENCKLLYLPKDKQLKLYDEHPKIERYFRILMENAYVSTLQRIQDNLSLSAETRYLHFKQKFPQVELRIPSKHIASYIGVTPEFFSKMKSKMLRA